MSRGPTSALPGRSRKPVPHYVFVTPCRSSSAFRGGRGWGDSCLNNHLGDALATEGLGVDEVLATNASKEVAETGEGEEDTGGDQRRNGDEGAEELHDGHDNVGTSAHVVGGDLANEPVELGRGRADAEKQRDFNEEDDQGGCAAQGLLSARTRRVITRRRGRTLLTWPEHRRCTAEHGW